MFPMYIAIAFTQFHIFTCGGKGFLLTHRLWQVIFIRHIDSFIMSSNYRSKDAKSQVLLQDINKRKKEMLKNG